MFGDCSVSKASVEASCHRMEQQLRSQTNTLKVVHQLRQVRLRSLLCMELHAGIRTAAALSSCQAALYMMCMEQRPTSLLRWGPEYS